MAGRHRFRASPAVSGFVFPAISPQLPVVSGVDPSGSPAPAASTSPDPSTSGAGSSASGPTVTAATTAAPIVPYQAIDYRHQVVASGTGTGLPFALAPQLEPGRPKRHSRRLGETARGHRASGLDTEPYEG